MIICAICNLRMLNAISQCESVQDLYDEEACKSFWDCTSVGLLYSVNRTVNRESFGALDIEKIGHTPLWLRIHLNKLHCVIHPGFRRKRYRIKIYRAAHYINRLNRILRQRKLNLTNGIEWWTHHSDLVKVSVSSNFPPVFSVSGAPGFADIAGIPFMSFSDKLSALENNAFQRLEADHNNYLSWNGRKRSAFFRGALSDCASAVNTYAGDVNFCARGKVIYYSVNSNYSLLSGISTSSDFEKIGLNVECKRCHSPKITGEGFIHDLMSSRYVLDFAGAGSWSRRMSLLLRSGALIFQSERQGYQFYELGLKPGVHFIPFDPEIGISGSGSLLSRLEWAQKNDKIAEQIANRAQSFGRVCLTESSIDYFVSRLLVEYSKFLGGNMLSYPLVDLSSCTNHQMSYFKLSKHCEATIQKCWGG